ncbi:Glu/Leu/Phe/Val dehydrogenase dimerization domain-containing protein [Thalassobaculum sp.]|uniref:Leu/Phe/Val dehydrogenase n=1 Tax=Thalassobaculum sp. TaxID=2022740 RepID=UPI0032EAF2E5
MSVFTAPDFAGHEQVVFASDPACGLRAIIAIHDTTRGPALGGCRMWHYASEADAVADVLRLSQGMTYKSALAELPLGGGKAVVLGDPAHDKSEALWRALGRAIDRLGGHYVTAEDVGTSVADLETVRTATAHVAGIAEGGSGDPSPATAFGVFMGMQAAVRHRLGGADVTGIRVALQGLGHVGLCLAGHLAEAGAELVVADLDPGRVDAAVERFGARRAEPAAIHAEDVEVFAPCALGAILNDRTIPELRAPVVAGSANNQLAEARHGGALAEHGVLYAPDYAINAGGIINVSHESTRTGRPYDRQAAYAHIARIHDTLARIFEAADAEGIPTSVAADRLAEARLRQAA